MKPHIGISYINTIPGDEFDEFKRFVSVPGVDVQVVRREPPGPMAGIEWLMPTVVIGFVASAYFGGFFQEMGKDHYLVVKERFKKLYAKVAGPNAPDVQIVASAGKVKPVQPYSLFFSLVGEGPDGRSIKLLLKKPISEAEYEATVEPFLEFLLELNTSTLSESAAKRFESVTPIGRTLLVVFDETLKEIVPIDPMTGELVR